MLTSLTAALCLLAPDVDMILTTTTPAVPPGCLAEVELTLSSTTAASVAAVDVILSWNPAELTLIQALPSGEDWLVAAFLNDPDGINDDLLDGQALFTALINPANPLALPPDPLVATFVFEVIADGSVGITPTAGAFGETAVIGVVPGPALTGVVSGPVAITATPVAALEVPRLGTPPNPDAFKPGLTSGPVIGQTWDPFVDHTTFMPTAMADFLGIAPPTGFPDLPSPFGTILIDIFSPIFLVGGPAGAPFNIGVPFDCSLVGVEVCSQAASIDPVDIQATNALDLTIGTF
ncbi:hypothetical protein [Engelhardtia mirabilis]|uniref:Cohesin domain protein n=1 Tax=Engelhardtia mirabilis TaxID=2528011 RepID=A0A518BQX3_9BACT|nr:hypothetical protein Pla133_44910 [Planctomycetes bacterium Pla133]QDV03698.1 hypothetical protein Pla86_44890 [Planctomycetes bacterium Pla86]